MSKETSCEVNTTLILAALLATHCLAQVDEKERGLWVAEIVNNATDKTQLVATEVADRYELPKRPDLPAELRQYVTNNFAEH